MNAPAERNVLVNDTPCRVWEAGDGPPLAFLAGLGGIPRWTPFLARLAESRRVVAPSLPGHPGGPAYEHLDSHLDWVVAIRELLDTAGAGRADLLGVSVGGALAADVAALWRESVPRLALVAPLGLYDPAEPVTDVWAQRPDALGGLLCHDEARYRALFALPDGADQVEWQVERVRAATAEARLLWPMCDTGLARRLHRITAPTLLVWGEEDRVIAPSYAERFAAAIPGSTTIRTIADAGHLVDVDQPERLAEAVLDFLG